MKQEHLHTAAIDAGYRKTASPHLGEGYTLHCHHFYEIYFFLQGDLEYRVEGHSYRPTPHSVLLIPPHAFHGFKYTGADDYERYSFHFLPQLLPKTMRTQLLAPFHSEQIYFKQLEGYHLPLFLSSVLAVQNLPAEVQASALEGRMVSLLAELYSISGKQRASALSTKAHDFSVDTVLLFISTHLDQKLALDDLCNQFYISKNHLNRLFKKATGTTVNSYINYKRLTLAKEYILQGKTATEASLHAGFGDYSNFYRTCRNLLNVAPSELQNQTLLGSKEFWHA